MSTRTQSPLEEHLAYSRSQFENWEVLKDVIDQLIDLILNYRQSGHPGGSRSKVHALVTSMLSGAMRWDIRSPEKRFGDRFVLVAGHTAPVIYTTLAALGDVMRTMHEKTGDDRFKIAPHRIVLWEDLLQFRRRGGLAGHAEMEGKTLFFKFNTGPSGHGSPAAAGEALALMRAGADSVKVWAFEGEGGHTTGATHETKNSAWGLKLKNLIYVLDWNDFGIDDHPVSMIVPGNPQSWFEPYGWRVEGAEDGSQWEPVTRAILEIAHGDNPDSLPGCAWVKTRKGRGYGKYDYKSHGAPHKRNSEEFWACRKEFADKYGVTWNSFGESDPGDGAKLQAQMEANLNIALDVLRNSPACEAIANRLVEVGDSVPEDLSSLRLDTSKNPLNDPELYDFENYPAELYAKPGDKQPNRAGLGKWGAYINAWSKAKYGRPLFLVCSADLADSTNISGFGKGHGDFEGWGKYVPGVNPEGALVPQEITEFTNSGLAVGLATVNLSKKPLEEFNGFLSGCSTYGSFSYLKYGPMRLFAQVAQDSDIKVGKVLWVAGHSGPETADDSRTHFGIFAPGVTQLFPEGHVVDVHPWEFNEVPVVIAAALKHPKA
ncbi:MAG: transketolase, partial [Candidatus Eisenbacteria bacterium]|nr:transketolase [Candidatus Eisenbacteria bacterium]